MKYNAIVLMSFILLGISVCIFGWSKVYEESPRLLTPSSKEVQETSNLPHYKVAVIALVIRPTTEVIINGFRDTLEKQGRFDVSFRVYDPESDRNLLRSHVEDIFNGDYDLVYSIGLQATKMLKEVSERRNNQTPIVFSNVINPVQFDLVASLERSGNNLTGVPADCENIRYVHFLTRLKKGMKKVLMVYDPTGFGGTMEERKKEVQEVFEKQNIIMDCVAVFNVDEISKRVAPCLQDIDMVVTLQDNTAINGIKHLTKLCDMYHIPLASAGGLELVKKGVTFSFDIDSYRIGTVAGRRALQILEQGVRPTDIPISNVGKKWQMLLNSKAMKRQKFELDKTMNFLLKHTFVVGGKQA